jgi:hypothetical protein
VKHYELFRFWSASFTWSSFNRPDESGTPVNLDDPSLPDEVVDIDAAADAFPPSTDD